VRSRPPAVDSARQEETTDGDRPAEFLQTPFGRSQLLAAVTRAIQSQRVRNLADGNPW